MRSYLIVLLIVWAVYVILTFMAPAAASTTRYGLTLAQTNLLRFTVILPLLFIWATLLYSITRFRRYRDLLDGDKEGIAFEKIVMGLWMLLIVAVVPSLVSSIANYWPDSAEVLKFSTIIRNYISAVFYLIGFWYLWQGSRDLYHTVASGLPSNKYRLPILIGVIILAIALVTAIANNPYRSTSTDPLVNPTYYLPDILIFLTIVIPYVLTWLFGGLTILNLLSYTRKVQGSIYRKTFSYFAYGLIITIVLLVLLQFLSQANAALGHAALSVILVIIYLLFFSIAAGYLLIARGARKLTAIEEVK